MALPRESHPREIHLIPKWRPINYSFVCMLNGPLCLNFTSKFFCILYMLTRQRGLINMHTKELFIGCHFGIRPIRSKNKSVYENDVTGMECSCMLLLVGSCHLLFYPIFHGFSSPGCLVESCYKREPAINSIQIIAVARGGGVRKGRAGDQLAKYLQQLS